MSTEPRTGSRWDALLIYYVLEGASSLLFQVAITIYTLFYAITVGLDPLQIVLMGTVFEATIFLFEVPTGVVADVYSRRVSIIIGVFLIGVSWLAAGLFPLGGMILLSEIMSGIGSTFTSGATEAWITDEIGIERASAAFLRSAQFKTLAGMVGIVISVGLASVALNLPFIAAGASLMVLAGFLLIAMPETGFKATPANERSTWQTLFSTFREGLRYVRLRPALLYIFIIGLIFAAHTEGFDHLWQKHVADNFVLPSLGSLNPVVWFGIINLVASVLTIGLTELVRRRIDLQNHRSTGRTLALLYGLVVGGIFVFALAGNFWLAVTAYWCIAALRGAGEPVSKAWLNQHTDSSIRATLFSMSGQVNALGEMVGGPPVGLIGKQVSLRAALAACGGILLLTAPFFAAVLKRGQTSSPQSVQS